MALIQCAECGKSISEKAVQCPHCGNPMATAQTEVMMEQELLYPGFPDNLEIGKQIVNWGSDSAFEGYYDLSENVITEIADGKVTVILHTHGLQLMQGIHLYPIHNDQIISIKQTSRQELISKDKTVIGRAVVGGLILGPLGAIVGGMSGIGTKEQIKNRHYLVLNYWEIASQSAQTLLIAGEKNLITAFIKRHQQEQTINQTENRVAEKDKPSILPILFIILVLAVLGILLFL